MTPKDRDVLEELASTLNEIGPALVPVGFNELLESITDTARSLFAAAACSLALVDERGEHLTFEVASGTGAAEVVGVQVEVGKGIAGWVAASGQPIAIADVAKDRRFEAQVAVDTGYMPRSIVAMPLETDRGVVGVIEVLDASRDGRDTSRDMEMLATFARQAALAIEGSRIFRELGTALLEAAATASPESLADALRERARSSHGDTGRLTALTAELHDLIAAGPREIEAAAGVLQVFASYAKRRGRRR
jgi:GAF domain-containing protein